MAGAIAGDAQAQGELDTLLQNIITSSAIEGEQLNVASVRSSLARRLGMPAEEGARITPRSEGMAELMLDATQRYDEPLDMPRLLHWHAWLFPQQDALLAHPIRVGSLRGEEPMQVVSGRIDRPTVHFEAPPREGLEAQVEAFLNWFNQSRGDVALDPLLRAGMAHFWFVTLHPFDDGNGRLTRAITDLALAQAEHQAIRFYTMSASILTERAGYYSVLESSQKASLDITAWLQWFLTTFQQSLQDALQRIDRVLAKTRFWQQHHHQGLLAEQIKVLNRLLDGGERGFEQGISAAKYQAVAKVSKATATRHLADLLDKGCLERLPGGGRSTRYRIKSPGVNRCR
jgi:Fic family protein